jgi:hypothetical protein
VTCSKRTSYLQPPEQKYFEYDDEQEEFNPFEPYEGETIFFHFSAVCTFLVNPRSFFSTLKKVFKNY